MTHLKDTLLAHIKSGRIDMKPKWHFVVRSISYVSGLLLVGVIGLYLMSLVLFFLRESGLWWTPGFGLRGLLFFVTTSPWILIAITLVFLGTLYVLVRHFGHNYRHHAIYSLIGLVLFSILGTSLMHYVAVHNVVRNWSQNHHIPGLSPLYRDDMNARPRDITPGRVTALLPQGFLINNRDGEYIVLISNETKTPPNFTPTLGEELMIFGPLVEESTIAAKGIRPLPPPLQRHLEKRESR